MSDNKMVLHPLNPLAGLDDPGEFLIQLQQVGFISDGSDWFGEFHYLPGNAFFDCISFLNEHTAILLEPSQQGIVETARVPNSSICHIFISPVSDEPEVNASGYTTGPSCPNCNYDEPSLDPIGKWYNDKVNYRWKCPACKLEFPIQELNWHRAVGFSRYFIDVWNIHFDEAVPSSLLLQKLQSLTGETWTYFYYRL